jgi:pimeloyl-ACP methyl ester carboxylesterase
MATYVLVHGAGSDSFYWHLVAPALAALGHDVVAPDLPCDDDSAGFGEYAEVVLDTVAERADLVVVAQSLGGFTAPLVCARRPSRLLVLVAAMVPAPGEAAGEWWANTGWEAAHRAQAVRDGRDPDAEFDPASEFFHDVAPDVTTAVFDRGVREQSGTPFERPWPLEHWPDVPTRFLAGRDDRFFPLGFQRRVVRERLGIAPDEIASGHLPALACPDALVDRLERYRTHGVISHTGC